MNAFDFWYLPGRTMAFDVARPTAESSTARRMVLRCVLTALIGCAACGSESPTTPSEQPATAFTPGRYQLSVNGPQGLQGCVSPFDQFFLSTRTVFLALSLEGGEWVARQDMAPGADVVLRIRESPSSARISTESGTIQGTMVTALTDFGGVALAATFADTIPVTGMSFIGAGIANGTFSGNVTFTDPQRPPMICPSGDWRLGKLPF
jgi:hypothetical protein